MRNVLGGLATIGASFLQGRTLAAKLADEYRRQAQVDRMRQEEHDSMLQTQAQGRDLAQAADARAQAAEGRTLDLFNWEKSQRETPEQTFARRQREQAAEEDAAAARALPGLLSYEQNLALGIWPDYAQDRPGAVRPPDYAPLAPSPPQAPALTLERPSALPGLDLRTPARVAPLPEAPPLPEPPTFEDRFGPAPATPSAVTGVLNMPYADLTQMLAKVAPEEGLAQRFDPVTRRPYFEGTPRSAADKEKEDLTLQDLRSKVGFDAATLEARAAKVAAEADEAGAQATSAALKVLLDQIAAKKALLTQAILDQDGRAEDIAKREVQALYAKLDAEIAGGRADALSSQRELSYLQQHQEATEVPPPITPYQSASLALRATRGGGNSGGGSRGGGSSRGYGTRGGPGYATSEVERIVRAAGNGQLTGDQAQAALRRVPGLTGEDFSREAARGHRAYTSHRQQVQRQREADARRNRPATPSFGLDPGALIYGGR